jgi:hypothetical protein
MLLRLTPGVWGLRELCYRLWQPYFLFIGGNAPKSKLVTITWKIGDDTCISEELRCCYCEIRNWVSYPTLSLCPKSIENPWRWIVKQLTEIGRYCATAGSHFSIWARLWRKRIQWVTNWKESGSKWSSPNPGTLPKKPQPWWPWQDWNPSPKL